MTHDADDDDRRRRPADHPMYTPSDLAYLRGRGYDDAEVLAFWDRDARQRKGPLTHGPIPDVVGRLTTAVRTDTGAADDALLRAAAALLAAKDDGMETAAEWDALREAVARRRSNDR